MKLLPMPSLVSGLCVSATELFGTAFTPDHVSRIPPLPSGRRPGSAKAVMSPASPLKLTFGAEFAYCVQAGAWNDLPHTLEAELATQGTSDLFVSLHSERASSEVADSPDPLEDRALLFPGWLELSSSGSTWSIVGSDL